MNDRGQRDGTAVPLHLLLASAGVLSAILIYGALTGHWALVRTTVLVLGVAVVLIMMAAILRHVANRPAAAAELTTNHDPLEVLGGLMQSLLRTFPELDLQRTDALGLVGNTRQSLRSFGEQVEIRIERVERGRSSVTISSRSRRPALLDYGVNRRNVDRVMAALQALLEDT